jgi:hypothetical protein
MLKADDLLGLDEPGQSGSMRNQRSSVGASSVPMDIDIDDDVGQIVDMTGVKVNDDDEVSFACFVHDKAKSFCLIGPFISHKLL